MRNLDTDEIITVYKDGTTIVIQTPDVGEIALSKTDANDLGSLLLRMVREE